MKKKLQSSANVAVQSEPNVAVKSEPNVAVTPEPDALEIRAVTTSEEQVDVSQSLIYEQTAVNPEHSGSEFKSSNTGTCTGDRSRQSALGV